MLARNDPSVGTNQPAAGNFGVAQYAIDLSQADWNDTQRTTLNSSNCNVIRRMLGGIRNYGWRSNVNAVSDANWVDFGNARFYMELAAELDEVGENYIFSQIDGQDGVLINSFNDALTGVMLDHYTAGELFGDTPAESFRVDTGPSVNTLARLANNELHAVVTVKMAPFAEYVEIAVVKRMVTQPL